MERRSGHNLIIQSRTTLKTKQPNNFQLASKVDCLIAPNMSMTIHVMPWLMWHLVASYLLPSHTPPVWLTTKAQTLDIKWFSRSGFAYRGRIKWYVSRLLEVGMLYLLCTCKIEYAGYGRCVTSIACVRMNFFNWLHTIGSFQLNPWNQHKNQL